MMNLKEKTIDKENCDLSALRIQREQSNGFKEHLALLNRSAKTIKSYTQSLNTFFHWLRSQGMKDLRQVSQETIQQYQSYLNQRNYLPNSLSLKLRSLKRLFEYLEKTRQVLFNPLEFINMPKLGDRLPKNILSQEEINFLLEQPDTSNIIGMRDKTMLELLYSTGIRLGELHNLNVDDADYRAGYLRINHGKGNKDRVLPIGKICCEYLREYINKVRPILTQKNKEELGLFVGQQGRRMHRETIIRLISGYGKACGLKKVTVHTFRHSLATHLVVNGADILCVKNLLGHSDLRTTQIYTRVVPKDLKQTHGKCHPREKSVSD